MSTIDYPIPTQAQSKARMYDPEPRFVGGPIVNASVAYFTAGLLPALWWPIRWGRDVAADRLAWLRRVDRLREADPENGELRLIADRLRPRQDIEVIGWVAGLVAMTAVVSLAATAPSVQWLFDFLFKRLSPMPGRHTYEREWILRSIWLYGLLTSYAFAWYSTRFHAVTISDLTRLVNKDRKKTGLAKIRNVATRTNLGWLWVLLTIVFCYHGAWWAIPMALAGGLQGQYLGQTGGRLRQAVDEHLATLPMPRRSADGETTVVYCGTSGCGRRLPNTAKFCPRCGHAAPEPRGAYQIL